MEVVMNSFGSQMKKYPTAMHWQLIRLALEETHPTVWAKFQLGFSIPIPATPSMHYWETNSFHIKQLLDAFLQTKQTQSAYAIINEMRQVKYEIAV